MNSLVRWTTLIALDLIFRSVFGVLFLNPLMIFVVPLLTLLYLPFLVAINPFDRETRKATGLGTSLLVTNFAFLVIVLGFWIVSIKSSSVMACADGRCAWTKGEITTQDAVYMAIFSVIQVVANTAPTLMLFPRRMMFWDDANQDRH